MAERRGQERMVIAGGDVAAANGRWDGRWDDRQQD